MTQSATDQNGVTLDGPRKMACLEAAWEIDALARILPGLLPDDEEDNGRLAVRGVAGRLLRLAFVVMNGIGDEMQPTEKLEKIISLDSGQG